MRGRSEVRWIGYGGSFVPAQHGGTLVEWWYCLQLIEIQRNVEL